MINSIGIKPEDVVRKPFNFADLIALIEGQ